MSSARITASLPIPVKRAMRKLGLDIRDARRRRRIPVSLTAERASISRSTLNKIENGDPGVSAGAYASVLLVLGLIDRLAELADASADRAGLAIEQEHLPQRVRLPRGPKAGPAAPEDDG